MPAAPSAGTLPKSEKTALAAEMRAGDGKSPARISAGRVCKPLAEGPGNRPHSLPEHGFDKQPGRLPDPGRPPYSSVRPEAR